MTAPGRVTDVIARIAAGGFAAAIAAGLVIGALGPPSWRAVIVERGPACPLRSTTGIDCPFCGMTRATVALGQGQWSDALALHPLAPVVLAGVVALAVIVALGRTDVLIRGKRPQLLLAAIAVIWLVRLVA